MFHTRYEFPDTRHNSQDLKFHGLIKENPVRRDRILLLGGEYLVNYVSLIYTFTIATIKTVCLTFSIPSPYTHKTAGQIIVGRQSFREMAAYRAGYRKQGHQAGYTRFGSPLVRKSSATTGFSRCCAPPDHLMK